MAQLALPDPFHVEAFIGSIARERGRAVALRVVLSRRTHAEESGLDSEGRTTALHLVASLQQLLTTTAH